MNLIAGIFVILLLTVTTKALPYLAKSRCDISLNLKCYIWVDTAATWQTAEDACVEWGGHLTSIHSDIENYAVRSIRDINGYTWIGLSDTANDGDYVWTDGTPFNYQQFSPGQPDSYNGESCFHLYNPSHGELTWNDYHCNRDVARSIQMSFVCKKGEPGEPGSNGLNGVEGRKGEQGTGGRDGDPGTDGLNGYNGLKGEQGSNGLNGEQGSNGLNGEQGRDGRDGYPGRDGVDGNIGPVGYPGISGIKGEPGTDGVNGEQGSNGGKGDKGKRGKRGFPGVYVQSKGTQEPVGSQDQSD